VCALAVGLRLALLASYEARHPQADRPQIDEAAYESWALEIAAGDWLGDEIFFQEPLYPYVLSAAYAAAGAGDAAGGRRLARQAQAVLGGLSAVLVAFLGRRLFTRGAGLLAGLGYAVYGPSVWMSQLLLKANLFVPLFAALALALATSGERAPIRRWLGIGVLVGLGALLRGNLLLLAPVLALWPLALRWRAREEARPPLAPALRACAACAAGIALALGPVALRNLAVGGRLVLSTSGAGTNVYGGNNPDNPYGIAAEFDWVRGVPAFEAGDWRHEAERRTGRALDAAETSRYWLGETARSVAADPLLHLSILWNKLRLTLGAYEVPDNHAFAWDLRYLPLLAWLPGFALVGSLGLAGLVLLAGHAAERRAVAALLVLYLATIVLTVTSDRVRLALVPLLLPFAAGLVIQAPRLASERPARAALALLACAAWVLVPALPAAKVAEDQDERDFNLAGQLVDAGDLDAAEPLLRDLAARHPDSARVARRLCELEYRQALPEIAAAAGDERRLLALQERVEGLLGRLRAIAERSNARERFRALSLAGAILQDQGQWRPAAAAYEQALEFDPEDRELRRRHALCLAEAALGASSDAERRAGLERAAALLEALSREARDERVTSLLDQVQSQL
jgi:4-amino-4-deoxy-L-arabinose transferase-like glycosyltransferase